MVAAIAGSFIGLVLGGVLGPIAWQLVFLVSVPVGVFGTVWAFLMLRDNGVRRPARIDWWGNLIFAVGLVALLVGITYGILPYGTATMGWGNPLVLTAMLGGVACLALFAYVETRVEAPMFHIGLFRIRAFAAGNLATLLSSLARGGLMFILIIWLQGIWLPQHGYSFAETPLWAGIYMLPMTAGFLIAGPLAGILSDRYGSRLFATVGVAGSAVIFAVFQVLPGQLQLRVVRRCCSACTGSPAGSSPSPNQAGIMNSLPPNERGAGAGMAATFQNSAMVLSIGIFFTLIILGLSSSLPHTLYQGLVTQGVPGRAATRISHLPAVGSLFASFLGYNPIGLPAGPGPAHAEPCPAGLPDRARLLPPPDLGALHGRPEGGLRLRDRRLRPGRDRQPAARRPVHPRRAAVLPAHVAAASNGSASAAAPVVEERAGAASKGANR